MDHQTQMDHRSQDEGEIIGYADPWIASPGQKVSVKVSRRFGCVPSIFLGAQRMCMLRFAGL